MSEAEDVLLEAATHVGAATRALWARGSAPEDATRCRAAAAERRVAAWLQAAFGVAPPIHPCDAPTPPAWHERLLGRPAPWRHDPHASAWTDGARIFLPRGQLEGAGPGHAEAVLLAALAQGLRIARGRAPAVAAPGVERDIRFLLEAALGDAELGARFPGLAGELAAARRVALSQRPDPSRLNRAEREVEAIAVSLLKAPAHRAQESVEALIGARPEPHVLAAFARGAVARLAADPNRYRGVAPVAHWGVPCGPPAKALDVATPTEASLPPGKRPRSQSLPRHLKRRAAEEPGDTRSGPFVLPHGDAHLSVQDARGVQRPEDRGDEEELDALAEELSRAGELPVVQGGSAAREVLEADGGAPRPPREVELAADGAGSICSYPEWDEQRGAYRDPGIWLRETPIVAADLAWAARVRLEHGALLAQVRRHFDALRPRRERIGRQLDGDLIDVDGIVTDHAERCAGLAPEGRFYARERPRRRDVAVLLLLDASGSTDAWVSRGERVIDVAKQAALCLGEALTALGDRHAIHAFSGRGPGDVRVQVAKRFTEPWSETVRGRLGALQPDRATRLGGPLRHATAMLARQPARARLLLVLSDGKPDDEDFYEGRYGLADVRQAVFEARRASVRTFCVTIDRAGPSYLPQLFGPAGYTVLWDVRQLPAQLPAIYRRLAVA